MRHPQYRVVEDGDNPRIHPCSTEHEAIELANKLRGRSAAKDQGYRERVIAELTAKTGTRPSKDEIEAGVERLYRQAVQIQQAVYVAPGQAWRLRWRIMNS